MPQQISTFESHFLTHLQDVVGAYHKLIACSWVPILQVGGLGKVRVNCFPKAITTWLGRESNPRPPDPESDALTTLPRCPCVASLRSECTLFRGSLAQWAVACSIPTTANIVIALGKQFTNISSV